jgi:hypothetical protein
MWYVGLFQDEHLPFLLYMYIYIFMFNVYNGIFWKTDWISKEQFAGIIGLCHVVFQFARCLFRALINSCVIIGKNLSSITLEIYIYDIAVNILFAETHIIAVMYIA